MITIITIIKESGFCRGVQSAINRANANFANIEAGQKVYLYGDLVNNSHVMYKYREKGFYVTNSIDDIEPNATVIIRAHGVPRAVCEGLQAKGVTIEDCTCAKVKNTHKIVEHASGNGSTIIIIGENNHPEVIGVRGWCKNDNAVVLETQADLSGIDWTSPICVVAQTTCKRDWWNKACKLVLQKCPGATIHNTLCSFMTDRSKKAAEIAHTVDNMIIVGDKKSANSVELYNTCRDICKNTYFVSSLEELLAAEIKYPECWPSFGLVGSASAPAEIVDDIYDYLMFAIFLAESKTKINGCTELEMERLMDASMGNQFTYSAVRDLFEQSRGGKCIRGTMIRLGEKAAVSLSTGQNGCTRPEDEKIAAKDSDNFLPVATAYEVFQTAILIHDDIIDRSEARRDKKTIHVHSYENQLAAGAGNEEAKHFGIARAICVGDYGLFLANNILAQAEHIDDAIKVRIFQQFSEIQLLTLEGEIMDVTLPFEPMNIEENYDTYMNAVYEIYRTKTAWYTLAGPLMIGAVCGGAGEQFIDELKEIALPLGIAFQIKDDLLGMYANDETLGKPAISDLAEKKQTLIYGYAYKHATAQQKSLLDRLYGKQGAAQADLEAVREVFTATGAKQFSEDKITELSRESLDLIKNSQINDECKVLLRGLVHYLIFRTY